jgi:hypothetical protein
VVVLHMHRSKFGFAQRHLISSLQKSQAEVLLKEQQLQGHQLLQS